MMRIRDLEAEEGEPIRTVLRRVVRFFREDATIEVQGPARIVRTARGRRVIYEPSPQIFPGSFLVAVRGARELAIGEGLVGGLVPYLDGRRLDGRDEEGELLPEGPPTMRLEVPEDVDRTYVLLWARHNESGEVDETIEQDSGDPAAYLEHVTELPPGLRAADRVARLVAVIDWRGNAIRQVRQVVWYDQEVYSAGGIARMRAAA